MCRIGNCKNEKDEKKNEKSREESIIVDPFGSWTGVNVDNKLEQPVQDVDDL